MFMGFARSVCVMAAVKLLKKFIIQFQLAKDFIIIIFSIS